MQEAGTARLHLGLALGHELSLLLEADRFAVHPEGHIFRQDFRARAALHHERR